ncbi:MAG: NAD(P)H-hydrate dehydratase [Oscillospiraceae bacterium]
MNVIEMTPPRLPQRRREAHKGDFGRVHIIAGSVGYTGAPVFAANAAVRGGAGLVFLGVPEKIYPIIATKCDEAMPYPLPKNIEEILKKLSDADVLLLGPGLGQSKPTEVLVLELLRKLACPIVLDADGINIAARHIDVLDARAALTILTPHAGEFARLGGDPKGGAAAAAAFAEKHNCTLVLKGHRTITAYADGTLYRNTTGNPGMARGGSGDALAGLMAALLAQGIPPETAVWLHGRAGDLAAEEFGEYGMTVGNLISKLPQALKECTDIS